MRTRPSAAAVVAALLPAVMSLSACNAGSLVPGEPSPAPPVDPYPTVSATSDP